MNGTKYLQITERLQVIEGEKKITKSCPKTALCISGCSAGAEDRGRSAGTSAAAAARCCPGSCSCSRQSDSRGCCIGQARG